MAKRIKLPTFEERYPVINHEIEKRRASWTLASVAFEDAKQIVLIRINDQYTATYDPRKDHTERPEEETFLHWVNKVISTSLNNILRDNLWKWSRPCIAGQGCQFNTGGDTCSKTPSGIQCAQCKAFKDWERRKRDHFNVKQTLPLENHIREADSIHSEFVDIDEQKKILDVKIMEKLTRQEQEIYRKIYIEGIDEKIVGQQMKFKKSGRTYAGYGPLLRVRHKAMKIAKAILDEGII